MEWIIITTLVVSNIFTFLYCRFLLKNLVTLSESMKDMKTMFDGFRVHVESLHELEMFYGDTSLQAMIEHSKFVVDQIDQYKESLSLTDQEIEGGSENAQAPE